MLYTKNRGNSMSDAMMNDFIKMTDTFSSEELVSAISILTEKLKKIFIKEKEVSLEKSLLQDRAEILSQINDGTLKTYSTMEEYRRVKSL